MRSTRPTTVHFAFAALPAAMYSALVSAMPSFTAAFTETISLSVAKECVFCVTASSVHFLASSSSGFGTFFGEVNGRTTTLSAHAGIAKTSAARQSAEEKKTCRFMRGSRKDARASSFDSRVEEVSSACRRHAREQHSSLFDILPRPRATQNATSSPGSGTLHAIFVAGIWLISSAKRKRARGTIDARNVPAIGSEK